MPYDLRKHPSLDKITRWARKKEKHARIFYFFIVITAILNIISAYFNPVGWDDYILIPIMIILSITGYKRLYKTHIHDAEIIDYVNAHVDTEV